jgi:hypothetical protein
VNTIAISTGGFSAEGPMPADALAVFESVAELRVSLDGSPLLDR